MYGKNCEFFSCFCNFIARSLSLNIVDDNAVSMSVARNMAALAFAGSSQEENIHPHFKFIQELWRDFNADGTQSLALHCASSLVFACSHCNVTDMGSLGEKHGHALDTDFLFYFSRKMLHVNKRPPF